MNIGICGNEESIKNGILMCNNLDLGSYTFVNYTPENLILDVEEGYFNCSLLFVDIGLDEFKDEKNDNYPSGIDLADKVNKRFPQCQIVYIADNNAFDERIYDTKHTFLMTRNSIVDKMPKALALFLDNMKSVIHRDVIEITSEGRKIFIHRNQIVYIERDARELIVATLGKKYPCYKSITGIMELMDDRMIRVNGGGIVNLGYVTYYGKGRIEISYQDEKKVMPVGRSYQKQVREAYYAFWEGHNAGK